MDLSNGGEHAPSSKQAPALTTPRHAPLHNVLGIAFHGAAANGTPLLSQAVVLDTFPVMVKIALPLVPPIPVGTSGQALRAPAVSTIAFDGTADRRGRALWIELGLCLRISFTCLPVPAG